MNTNLIGIGLIVIVLLAIYFLREGYTSKREKAGAIHDWLQNNLNPSFMSYRDSIKNGDIVEYSDVKKLKAEGGVSVDNIEKLL
jgi:hypothetical protein